MSWSTSPRTMPPPPKKPPELVSLSPESPPVPPVLPRSRAPMSLMSVTHHSIPISAAGRRKMRSSATLSFTMSLSSFATIFLILLEGLVRTSVIDYPSYIIGG